MPTVLDSEMERNFSCRQTVMRSTVPLTSSWQVKNEFYGALRTQVRPKASLRVTPGVDGGTVAIWARNTALSGSGLMHVTVLAYEEYSA